LDLVCGSIEVDCQKNTSIEQVGESSGWLSIEEIAAELELSQRKTTTTVPLAVDLIRQDRDAR
jgi:hypothetical protein